MTRTRIAVALAAIGLALGLASPAVAAQPPVANGYWGIYGQYPNRPLCEEVGAYLMSQHFYSNYSCSRSGSVYLLYVYDPY